MFAPSAVMNWPFGDLEPHAYGFIMADPPWRFMTRSPRGMGHKSPEHHYRTMTLDAIKALPVADLAARDCLLWLWSTSPMLVQCLDVLDAWGFRYCTMGFWSKRTVNGKLNFGTGYVLRSAGEPFLIGTIGEPKTTKSTRNVIDAKAREHSRKPDEAFRAAELLMPEVRRAELFSRQQRPGWDVWGNETDKFEAEGVV